jgi:hypothetical protein
LPLGYFIRQQLDHALKVDTLDNRALRDCELKPRQPFADPTLHSTDPTFHLNEASVVPRHARRKIRQGNAIAAAVPAQADTPGMV